jgi:hypothetical protein
MTRSRRTLLLAAFLLTAFRPWAHLLPGSLTSPAAGEAYEAGSTVTVSWTQSQAHAGTYLFELSQDGGATWTGTGSMRAPSGDGKAVSYAWAVPDRPSDKARFKVCQPGGPCSDPDYYLESGDFAIRAASPVRSGRAASAPVPRIRPGIGHMEVTLVLDRPGPITLHAVDASGASVLLLSETLPRAGGHHRRLSRGAGSPGSFLVLRTGGGGQATLAPD